MSFLLLKNIKIPRKGARKGKRGMSRKNEKTTIYSKPHRLRVFISHT